MEPVYKGASMNKKSIFALWGGFFILCAGLGFIQQPQGVLKTILTLISIAFFVPPAFLLYDSIRRKDLETLKLIRNLSALSLLMSLLLIILNIVCAPGPVLLGNILNSILTIVSAPMICCGNWFLSMFLWACLLMVSLKGLKESKKEAK